MHSCCNYIEKDKINGTKWIFTVKETVFNGFKVLDMKFTCDSKGNWQNVNLLSVSLQNGNCCAFSETNWRHLKRPSVNLLTCMNIFNFTEKCGGKVLVCMNYELCPDMNANMRFGQMRQQKQNSLSLYFLNILTRRNKLKKYESTNVT